MTKRLLAAIKSAKREVKRWPAREWELRGWETTNPELVRSDGYKISLRFSEYHPTKFLPFDHSKGYWCNQSKDTSRPHKQIVEGIVEALNESAGLRAERDKWKLAVNQYSDAALIQRAEKAESENRELRAQVEQLCGDVKAIHYSDIHFWREYGMTKRLLAAIKSAKREVKRWPKWARSIDPHASAQK